MVRTLQALTVLALISAGTVFALCVVQWLQDYPTGSGGKVTFFAIGP